MTTPDTTTKALTELAPGDEFSHQGAPGLWMRIITIDPLADGTRTARVAILTGRMAGEEAMAHLSEPPTPYVVRGNQPPRPLAHPMDVDPFAPFDTMGD